MHNLTKLKKLSIYSLGDIHTNNNKYDELLPTIEHLTGYSLKSLAIDDGFTGFLNSIDDLSSAPKYILSLDLSGKLLRVPRWIKELETLEKLTLSLTSLRTDVCKFFPSSLSCFLSHSQSMQKDRIVVFWRFYRRMPWIQEARSLFQLMDFPALNCYDFRHQ